MRSPGIASIGVATFTAGFAAALLARGVQAGDSGTLRAAEAGVSPGFCPALRVLVDAAGSGFTALRGEPQAGGEHMWAGTKRLPGGGDCLVFGGSPPSYSCTLYIGDVEENADGAYDRAVSGVKDCLTGSWKTTEKVDGVHIRTTLAAAEAGASVRVVSRDVSGDAYLVELWIDAPAAASKR
jgi:hypothetical protein